MYCAYTGVPILDHLVLTTRQVRDGELDDSVYRVDWGAGVSAQALAGGVLKAISGPKVERST